jgi:hypothetical protein
MLIALINNVDIGQKNSNNKKFKGTTSGGFQT